LEGTMRTLAGGNNKVDVAGTDRTDEVGGMAKAVLVFRDAAQEQERLRREIEKQLANGNGNGNTAHH
ncbi:hypothetical protein K4H03_24805, partial [Mycobacterium tuberculosis]|nr:hypothetical protein [Mycobacterium tuberculosis]